MIDSTIDVVYEDNHVVVVNKPANTPSQEDESKDLDMLSMVKAYIKVKYEKPGDVFIGLIHRLDRPAGGLMVFARTSKAASRLSEQMRSRKITKKYLAVVEGEVGSEPTDPSRAANPIVAAGLSGAANPVGSVRLEGYIEKNASTNKVAVYDIMKGESKFAALSYVCLQKQGGFSLVEVELETGRPHQIRAQMAHAGHALYGDQKYGHGRPGLQLALWSYELAFEHPVTKVPLRFVSLPPLTQKPWQDFSVLTQIAPF